MYVCEYHGEQFTEWCDDCNRILSCDCSVINYHFMNITVPYDNYKKETTCDIKVEICNDCGQIHNVSEEK